MSIWQAPSLGNLRDGYEVWWLPGRLLIPWEGPNVQETTTCGTLRYTNHDMHQPNNDEPGDLLQHLGHCRKLLPYSVPKCWCTSAAILRCIIRTEENSKGGRREQVIAILLQTVIMWQWAPMFFWLAAIVWWDSQKQAVSFGPVGSMVHPQSCTATYCQFCLARSIINCPVLFRADHVGVDDPAIWGSPYCLSFKIAVVLSSGLPHSTETIETLVNAFVQGTNK